MLYLGTLFQASGTTGLFPGVTVTIEPLAGKTEDPDMAEVVDGHLEVVRVLQNERVCWLRPGQDSLRPLSSKGTRLRPATVGTLLTSVCRDELAVHPPPSRPSLIEPRRIVQDSERQ
jgi:hypothetical protein